MRLEVVSTLTMSFAEADVRRPAHPGAVVATSAQGGCSAPEGRHLCSSASGDDKLRRSGIGIGMPPLRGWGRLFVRMFLQRFRSYGAGSIRTRQTNPLVALALKPRVRPQIRATRQSP